MGLDLDLLGDVSYPVKSRNFGLRRDGILAISVSFRVLGFEASNLLIDCSIKVLALIVFFILAIIISAGGIGPRAIGFEHWHSPGAFADSINGVAKTFVVAGTLYAGTEMYVLQHRRWWGIAKADSQLGLASPPENRRIPKKQYPRLSGRSFGVS